MTDPEEYTFQGFYIPSRMIAGIRRYVDERIPPGRFLTAIIQNNLSGAVGQADDENMKNIPAFVGYCYNKTPGACWGSKAKMKAWLEGDPK